jgi:RING finger protein 121
VSLISEEIDLCEIRKVYAWFFWVFNVAHITLILGVIIAVLRLLGIVSLISMVTPKFLVNLVNSKVGNWIFPHAHILIFYGLYFGILVRDCAEQCADRMANYFTYMRNKFYNSARREERSCGICGVQFEPEFLFDVIRKRNWNAVIIFMIFVYVDG